MKILGIFDRPTNEITTGWHVFERPEIEYAAVLINTQKDMDNQIANLAKAYKPQIVFTDCSDQNPSLFQSVVNNSDIQNHLIATDSPEIGYKILCKVAEHTLYFVKSQTFHRKHILDMITALCLGNNCVGAEIGVYKGTTSLYLSQQRHIKRIYAIDPWDDIEGYQDDKKLLRDISRSNTHGPAMESDGWERLYVEVSELLSQQSNIVVLRDYSSLACDLFEDLSLDFVFIDGDHSYESVCFDIEAWTPKIKQGGIIAGHDYTWNGDNGSKRGLVKAVHDYFEANSKLFCDVLDHDRNRVINRADDRVWWQQLKG